MDGWSPAYVDDGGGDVAKGQAGGHPDIDQYDGGEQQGVYDPGAFILDYLKFISAKLVSNFFIGYMQHSLFFMQS